MLRMTCFLPICNNARTTPVEALRKTPINMEKEIQRKLADKEITNSALLSAGCGAIPVAYLDVAGTIAIQTRMIKNLCDIYGVQWDEHIVKGLLGSVLGNIGKRTIASMIKSIPLVGQTIGSFANAMLSYASSIALGRAFVKYMEVNSTIKSVKDIDLGVFTDFYNSFSSQASAMAEGVREKLRGQKKDQSQPHSSDGKEPLTKYGERIFGSQEKFTAWMNKPNAMIQNKKPIDLFMSSKEEDHDKVRRLITVYAESKAKV